MTDDDLFNKEILDELWAANASAQMRHMNEFTKVFKINPVLAGVQSCVLATQVLRLTWKDPTDTEARLAVSAAHAVLETWGIELTTEPADPVKNHEPPAPVLVWPPVDRLGRPLSTVLPDVYRENYYHVHEKVLMSDGPAMGGWLIQAEMPLVLHEAYWNEESLQWRMRLSVAGMPNRNKFWLDHSRVKPGAEIPKVIDQETQARSNDP